MRPLDEFAMAMMLSAFLMSLGLQTDHARCSSNPKSWPLVCGDRTNERFPRSITSMFMPSSAWGRLTVEKI